MLSGEIYALMDEGEVLLKAGDVLIQRGTNHAWSNRTERAVLHRLRADRRRAGLRATAQGAVNSIDLSSSLKTGNALASIFRCIS